jgi:hypothetical protein
MAVNFSWISAIVSVFEKLVSLKWAQYMTNTCPFFAVFEISLNVSCHFQATDKKFIYDR